MTDPATASAAPSSRHRQLVLWSTVLSVLVLAALYGGQMVDSFVAVLVLLPVWLVFIAVMVVLLVRLDPFRTTRTHRRVLLTAAGLGGTLAVVLATAGDELLDTVWPTLMPSETAEQWSAALSAPIAEELVKLLCVYVLITATERAVLRPAHAFLLGVFVGFGFDVVEDFIYTLNAAVDADPGSELGDMTTQMAVRMATIVPGHWTFTGVGAVGLLLLLQAKAAPEPSRRRVIAAGWLAAAWFMHFVWDLPDPGDEQSFLQIGTPARWIIDMVVFGALYRSIQRGERRYVRNRVEKVPTDPADPLGVMDPEVSDSLDTVRARRALRSQARRNGGRRVAAAIKAAQVQALDLLQATPSPFRGTPMPAAEAATPALGRHRFPRQS